MKKKILFFSFLILAAAWLSTAKVVRADLPKQQPTVAIATVTSTPSGPIGTVTTEYDQVNVRSGPGVEYPTVGVLVAGQNVPVLGRSVGGNWVLVSYPGIPGSTAWVYSYLIAVKGTLPVVAPPPTPTPRVTPTIDPTLASQFVVEIQPTRLPTYTAPPPLVIPTYTTSTTGIGSAGVPTGFIIGGMAIVGLFGLMISILRGR